MKKLLQELRDFIVLNDDEGLVAHSDMIQRVDAALSAQPASAPLQDEDAKRWRALLASARIRPLGSAGLTGDAHPYGESWNGYANLGLELWTVYGASLNTEQLERLAKENLLGIDWLTKYTDIAIAIQAQGAKQK